MSTKEWREAHPEYHKQYRETHREQFKEYNRRYYACLSDEQKATAKERMQKWWKDNSERNKQHCRAWQKANTNKLHAHRVLRTALRNGTLRKQPCCACGCEKTEAHHEDYTKPLDVMWLCRPCHNRQHHNRKET